MLVFNDPPDPFKLIVIDFDNFHLLSCLATQQGSELLLDNNKLYHLLLGGLGVLWGTFTSSKCLHFLLVHITREMLDGSSWVSPM